MSRKSNAQIEREAQERQAQVTSEARSMAQAMMAEMLPAIIAGLTTQLADKRTELGSGAAPINTSADRGLLEGLATAIVKVGDPKNRNRTVDPAVMSQRKEAKDKMVALLIAAHARGEKPVYQLTGSAPHWLNDTLVHPQWRDEGSKKFHQTEIEWDRIPNEGMLPMTDLAREVSTLYKASIGSVVVEGLPDAPWLNPEAPWVFSKEGIVKGRPNHMAPEMAGGGTGSGLFDDPRRPGHSSIPERRETRVLGSAAPPVVETVGV